MVTLAAVPLSAGDMFGTGTVDVFIRQLLLVIGEGCVGSSLPRRHLDLVAWLSRDDQRFL